MRKLRLFVAFDKKAGAAPGPFVIIVTAPAGEVNGLKDNRRLFEENSVFSAVVRLALPSVIGQMILVIYNMADTYFVGMTDSTAMLTAVTVCMPAFMFLSAISNLFGVGGAGVISRCLGRRETRRASDTSAFAVWGCCALAAVYSLGCLIFLNAFVDLLGGRDVSVHPLASSYLTVTVVICGVPTAMNNLLAHLLRSEGRSFLAGVGIAGGGVLNIALDPLFMFRILKPGREVLGAAIATGISNVAAMVYFIVVILRFRGDTVLSARLSRRSFTGGIPKEVAVTGGPACLMTLCENVSYAILDNLISVAGTVVQAGVGVAKKVNMLAHCIVRGLSQGVLPLIAYNYASGNHRRMRASVLTGLSTAVALSCLCMTANLIFAPALVGIFIDSGTAPHEYGVRFLKILSLGAPFSACAYMLISFFQAVGRGGQSLLLALLRKGIVDIPMMFILVAVLPVSSIVWATPAADLICCAVSVVMLISFLKIHHLDVVDPGILQHTAPTPEEADIKRRSQAIHY